MVMASEREGMLQLYGLFQKLVSYSQFHYVVLCVR
jgi:hypothetical protein